MKRRLIIVALIGLALASVGAYSRGLLVPAADSAANQTVMDVVGNKTDTVAGTSLMSIIKSVAGGAVSHVTLYTGTVYYVSKSGNDSNDGESPDGAKLTLTAAEALASVAGDRIKMGPGTYTENVTMDVAGTELIGEQGAVIAGTLTVSADNCVVCGVIIAPTSAVGLAYTGNRGRVCHVRVVGTPTTAFDIDGYQNIVTDVIAVDYTVSAFDVSNYNILIRDAIAQGDGGARRGYYFSNAAADACTLDHIKSAGNATASVEFVSGCAGSTVYELTSGFGDGRWVDADEAQVWADINFADRTEKEITFAIGGGGDTVAYNLFTITGVVRINSIVGIVETVLTGTNTDCFLDVFSANGQTDLSKDTTLAIGAAGVGSALARLDKADKILTFGDATAAPFLMDEIDTKKEGFRVGEDRTGAVHVATYIRFTHTAAAAATGAIHWYIEWEPISEDGWLAMTP